MTSLRSPQSESVDPPGRRPAAHRSRRDQVTTRRRLGRWLVGVVAAMGVAGCGGGDAAVDGPFVLATTIDGPITPVTAGHVRDGIARAEDEGAVAYLIRIDTPGGLDISMRDIVQEIYAATVPVIVHVAPAGARGASAGAIITFAAHVAAMAPGTAIGAATPVAGGGGEDLDAKVINDAVAYAEAIAEYRGRDVVFIADTVSEGRSASAEEALELGAIDLVAATTEELLAAIDGITVAVGEPAVETVLETAGVAVVEQDMGIFRSIQGLLADPTIAFLLLSIGSLGIVYELATPGLGVGGVLGLMFIVFGLFGLAVLSVNVVGIILLLVALALFVAEVFAPGIGIAAAGGALALIAAAVFLVDDAPGLEVSLYVVVPTAIVIAAAVVVAGRLAMRVRRSPSTTTGTGVLIGHEGPVTLVGTRPQLFVTGAWWRIRPADTAAPMVVGSIVRVVDVDGLTLVVAPVESAEPVVSVPTVDISTSKETS